jgi:hypothetical protein
MLKRSRGRNRTICSRMTVEPVRMTVLPSVVPMTVLVDEGIASLLAAWILSGRCLARIPMRSASAAGARLGR